MLFVSSFYAKLQQDVRKGRTRRWWSLCASFLPKVPDCIPGVCPCRKVSSLGRMQMLKICISSCTCSAGKSVLWVFRGSILFFFVSCSSASVLSVLWVCSWSLTPLLSLSLFCSWGLVECCEDSHCPAALGRSPSGLSPPEGSSSTRGSDWFVFFWLPWTLVFWFKYPPNNSQTKKIWGKRGWGTTTASAEWWKSVGVWRGSEPCLC